MEAARVPSGTEPDPAGVTVVVPVYNPGAYFERTLSSLVCQTLSPDRYEIMLVDDGSTDGTAERLDRAAAAHPGLVRVTHIPNSGWPGRPRNVGTELATFDYVFYCDADDWLPEHSLETLLSTAVADNSDLVVSRVIGNRRGVPSAIFDRGDFCTNWVETPAVFSNLTTQKLFSRAFLRRCGLRFSEGKVRLEDFIFMTQAYLQAERISVIGSRPCYVLELRDDRGNLTATTADEDAYFDSVDRIIDIVEANTAPGKERDLGLDRVVRAELIGSVTSRGWLRKPEPVRVQALQRARQMLHDRVPPSAIARLDARTRQRADAILREDRALIERWIGWDAAVSADLQLAGLAWEDGRLRFDLQLAFHRNGEVMRLERSGDRFFVRPPESDRDKSADDEGFDVTKEVDRAAVHLILRSRDISEDWRIRAKTAFQSGAKGDDEIALRWSSTAVVDFATISAGRPLRAGVWDVYARLGSCGMQRDRRLGSARAEGVEEPPPALLDGLAVSPFFTGPGNLSFDVEQWTRPLAAEVARRGAGPARLSGRSMTAPLPLVLEGSPPDVEVHLLPARRSGAAPLVRTGSLVRTSAGSAELAVTLPQLRPGRKWSVRLRFGGPGSGPTTPVDFQVAVPGPVGRIVRRLVGERLSARMSQLSAQAVSRRPEPAQLVRSALRKGRTGALRLGRVVGLKITGIASGSALVSAFGEYDVDSLVPGRAYVVSRKTSGRGKLKRLVPAAARDSSTERAPTRNDPVFLAAGQTLTEGVDVTKVGPNGWLVSRRNPSAHAELELETQVSQHVTTRHVAWLLHTYRVDCVLLVDDDGGRYADALRRLGYRGSILALPDPLDRPGLDEVLAPPAADGATRSRLFLKADASDRAVETLELLRERRHDVVGVQFRVGLDGNRVPQPAEALAAYEAAGFALSGSSPAARRRDGRVTELEYTMVRVDALPD